MALDEEFIQRCVAAGFRSPSPGKREIARRALAMTATFTAKGFSWTFQEEGGRFSLATVYRTLWMLEQVGMIRREGDELSVVVSDTP